LFQQKTVLSVNVIPKCRCLLSNTINWIECHIDVSFAQCCIFRCNKIYSFGRPPARWGASFGSLGGCLVMGRAWRWASLLLDCCSWWVQRQWQFGNSNGATATGKRGNSDSGVQSINCNGALGQYWGRSNGNGNGNRSNGATAFPLRSIDHVDVVWMWAWGMGV
jgi:hypothetical protein